MALVTFLTILKYASTIITGIVAIIGARKEASDNAPKAAGAKPPRWKKWALIFAVTSLTIAVFSQFIEQKINDKDSTKLNHTLAMQTSQLNEVTNLLHESQQQASSYQGQLYDVTAQLHDVTDRLHESQQQANSYEEINVSYLNAILGQINEIPNWLAQMEAQSADCTNVIQQAMQAFKQFAGAFTNSPNPVLRQQATQILDQITNVPDWDKSQPPESTTPPPSTSISPPTFTLTVINGAGSGSYPSGTIVGISADAAEMKSGPPFAWWSGADISNTNSATTTVAMPASDLTVKANYRPYPPMNLQAAP